LAFGPLTVVQPLGGLTLVFAVPLAARIERRAPTRGEWLGVVAAVLGLSTLLALAQPSGLAHALDARTTGWVAAVILAAVAAVWLASRMGRRARGVWLAFGSGISSAVASSFTHAALVGGDWEQAAPLVGAVGIFMLLGLLLGQLSYQRSLSAPLATATITNPIAAATFGVLVLGEHATSGAVASTMALVAAAVAGAGIILLARSGAAQLAH
jgi:drug/metabolite transporter (DMT)-like permease